MLSDAQTAIVADKARHLLGLLKDPEDGPARQLAQSIVDDLTGDRDGDLANAGGPPAAPRASLSQLVQSRR